MQLPSSLHRLGYVQPHHPVLPAALNRSQLLSPSCPVYDTIRFIALTLRTDWYKSKSGWLDYLNLPGVQEENTFYSGY
jgi:hypothetical protein